MRDPNYFGCFYKLEVLFWGSYRRDSNILGLGAPDSWKLPFVGASRAVKCALYGPVGYQNPKI